MVVMETFNFFEKTELITAFKKHKPYLVDLEKLINEIKSGKLNLSFTVTDGNVLSMEVVGRQLVRYDKGERLGLSWHSNE